MREIPRSLGCQARNFPQLHFALSIPSAMDLTRRSIFAWLTREMALMHKISSRRGCLTVYCAKSLGGFVPVVPFLVINAGNGISLRRKVATVRCRK